MEDWEGWGCMLRVRRIILITLADIRNNSNKAGMKTQN